jgi:hypothetical protein
MPVPYEKTVASFLVDESPIRTAFPVDTLPPQSLPPINRPGHAGGSVHDPTCNTDMRRTLDLFVLNK